jgi:molecular chaperone DnaK
MRKFVKSPEDIVYGSAMLFDKERDEMIRQELTQLINKMQEIF